MRTIQCASRKAAIDDFIRKFYLKDQLHKRSSKMLNCAPDCSFYFTKQKAQSSSKNCKCYQFLSGRGKEFSWCNTEKNLSEIRLLPKERLTSFQAGDCIKGEIVCHGWRSMLQMKFWAMLQDYNVLKRGYYIYIGWGNMNYLGGFCSPQNNGKFGGQTGIFKPPSHSTFPKLRVPSCQPKTKYKNLTSDLLSTSTQKSY